jgi:hypothetical protein
LSEEETTACQKEIAELIKKDVIEIAPDPSNCTISPMFTVPKRDSTDRRPILNLKWINTFIEQRRFKTTTIKDAKAAVQPGDYMTKLDLSDAFFQIAVNSNFRKFLAFQWNGNTYQYKTLPFGLTSSPRILSETLQPIVQEMHRRGHRLIKYVDDWLLLGKTYKATAKATSDLISLFKELGVIWSPKKSVNIPTLTIEYLGYELDSVSMMCTTPQRKIKSLRNDLKNARRQAKNGQETSARELARLLGRINAMDDALHTTRAHTHGIYSLQMQSLRECGWDRKATWQPQATADVNWWIKTLASINGKAIIPLKASRFSATDASDFGWGAVLFPKNEKICSPRTNSKKVQPGPTKMSGHFTVATQSRHINFKELLTVKYLLQMVGPKLKNEVVEVAIDNQVAMSYINKTGGRVGTLATLADQIFDLCNQHNIKIQARWIPSEENIIADTESRKSQTTQDCMMVNTTFNAIDKQWGPHTMDLFASAQNKKLPIFASWKLQPGAKWTNAMKHNWTEVKNAYANPPPRLIPEIIRKVKAEKTTISLVTPLWWASVWIPVLATMTVDLPILLPQKNLQLWLDPTTGFTYPTSPRWKVVCWRISGNDGARSAFHHKLKRTWSARGSRPLLQFMLPPTPTGSDSKPALDLIHLIVNQPTL